MEFYINIASFILFLAFFIFYARQSFPLTFLYGLLFFQAFGLIPSLIYIEEGILINEQGRFSFFTGATILTVFYFIFTFIIIALSFKTFNKRRLPVFNIGYKGRNIDFEIIMFVVLLAQGLLLINAALSPLPLFDSSVTRFTYWPSSRFPFLNTFLGNTAIFIPFVWGLVFTKYKKFAVFMLLVYFGYNFLIGQKFSPIVTGAFSFLLPIVFYYKKNIFFLIRKNWIVLLSFFILMMGSMYYVIYKKYESTPPFSNIKIYDPNEAIMYRIFGLQGHLMWGATDRYVVNSTEEHSYNPLELLHGMPVMMKEFAVDGGGAVAVNEEIGFNFSNAYPGILFKIFPIWLAFIFHGLVTVIFLALMGWILKEFIVQRALLLSVVAYQLFNWTLYAFAMGYFYKLYSVMFFLVCYGTYLYFRKPSRDYA